MAEAYASEDPEVRAARLIEYLQEAATRLRALGVTEHEALISVALGFRDEPQTLEGLASRLGKAPRALRDEAWTYITSRPCFCRAWRWASTRAGQGETLTPAPLWAAGEVGAKAASEEEMTESVKEDTSWDAGALGCGELVFDLRLKMLSLKPGQVLKLTATDAGAPQDIPAWCGLTGHRLAAKQPPHYWIQRKED